MSREDFNELYADAPQQNLNEPNADISPQNSSGSDYHARYLAMKRKKAKEKLIMALALGLPYLIGLAFVIPLIISDFNYYGFLLIFLGLGFILFALSFPLCVLERGMDTYMKVLKVLLTVVAIVCIFFGGFIIFIYRKKSNGNMRRGNSAKIFGIVMVIIALAISFWPCFLMLWF